MAVSTRLADGILHLARAEQDRLVAMRIVSLIASPAR
jgi:hypothetical protein